MDRAGKTPSDANEPADARLFPTPRQVVVFQLLNQSYALPLHELQEILPLAALSKLPQSPTILAGFLNLAGTSIPVINLRHLFGLPDLQPTLYTPLLLLRAPNRFALIVDRVSEKLSVAADASIPLPDGRVFNNCVTEIIQTAEGNILLLSVERLMHEKERVCIAQLQAIEQQRVQEVLEVGS